MTSQELLRRLWKALKACGRHQLVEKLRERWLIAVDINQNYANVKQKNVESIMTSRLRAFRIRVSISDVILCGVTRMTSQVQSRVISICLDYVIQNTDVVYDVVDRIEQTNDVIVDSVNRQNEGWKSGFGQVTSSPRIVITCRCLDQRAAKRIWLIYKSGELERSIGSLMMTSRLMRNMQIQKISIKISISDSDFIRINKSFDDVITRRHVNDVITHFTHTMQLPNLKVTSLKSTRASDDIITLESRQSAVHEMIRRDVDSLEKKMKDCCCWQPADNQQLIEDTQNIVLLHCTRKLVKRNQAMTFKSLRTIFESIKDEQYHSNDLQKKRRHQLILQRFIALYRKWEDVLQTSVAIRNSLLKLLPRLRTNYVTASSERVITIQKIYKLIEAWRCQDKVKDSDVIEESAMSNKIKEVRKISFEIFAAIRILLNTP